MSYYASGAGHGQVRERWYYACYEISSDTGSISAKVVDEHAVPVAHSKLFAVRCTDTVWQQAVTHVARTCDVVLIDVTDLTKGLAWAPREFRTRWRRSYSGRPVGLPVPDPAGGPGDQ